MQFQKKRLALVTASLLATSLLAGCGGGSSGGPVVCEAPAFVNDAGKSCVTLPQLAAPVENPTIDTTPPGEPAAPADNELQIAFVDQQAASRAAAAGEDGPYFNWNLYLWNSDACSALAPSEVSDGWEDTSRKPDDFDEYGPIWNLKLAATTGCVNAILRDGTGKVIDPDLRIEVTGDRAVALTQGGATVFDSRLDAWESNPPGLGISEARAHWLDANTLVMTGVPAGDSVRLYFSADGSFTIGATGLVSGNYEGVALTAATLTDAQKAQFPHLAGFAAFSVPANINIKERLKGEVVAASVHADGYLTGATKVQLPGVIDALYTKGEADADEAKLGAIVTGDGVNFALWAPTAKSVKLHLFAADKTAAGEPIAMTLDPLTGIWSHAAGRDLINSFYKYEVEVYHPASGAVENLLVTDPYSVSLSTNSLYSQVVDLKDAALMPAGWGEYSTPEVDSIVIYESHIRDFSVADETVSAANRGKYLAFTETDSAAMKHLQALKDAGLSFFHLLPAFDIATVNEDPAMRVDITDTVAKLCEVNSSADACKEGSTVDRNAVIKDLLAAMDPASSDAQAFLAGVRGYDSFNWGYDPFHYGVPEGSYASNPDGSTRILEFRQMVKALHDMGLSVAMDVVYNHTNASGLNEKSVLDKVVPGYYHRLNATTGSVETSSCCDNTATENRMMAKLMIDTLATWTEAYKIDSFRFDLMGLQPLAVMEEALSVAKAINPNIYFYGEGWDLGDGVEKRFLPSYQKHLGGTGIGSFSDRLRDAVRGGSPFDSGDDLRKSQGFGSGLYNDPNEMNSGAEGEKTRLMLAGDQIMVELAGNLADFLLVGYEGEVMRGKDVNYNGQKSGYTQSPLEIVSYVEKHDNQTLWDNNQYKLPTSMTSLERARAQIFGLSFPLLGQGVPFIHMGADLLRSKSMERDSYDSGDWYNLVDFTGQTNNWNVGLPREDKDSANWALIKKVIANSNTKPVAADIALASDVFQELLSIRNSSKLFHLGSKDAVMQRVDFHNVGPEQTPGVIVMSIDDGVDAGADLDANVDAIVVVFNGGKAAYSKDLGVSGLTLHSIQQASADATYAGVSVDGKTVTVPGYTTAVFVLPQAGAQGAGIPVGAKVYQNCDPFDGTKIYLRGDFNDWGLSNQSKYNGCGLFTAVVNVDAAGSYAFKIGSSDWAKEVGFAGAAAAAGSQAFTEAEGGNFQMELAAGTYAFTLNASVEDSYTLHVGPYTDVAPLTADAFVVGGFNGWADGFTADYQLEYAGAGVYTMTYTTELEAELATDFKFASSDWDKVNYGADDAQKSIDAGQTKPAVSGSSVNFSTKFEPGYDYTFTLDLFYAEQPTVTLSRKAQAGVISCALLADSSDEGPITGPLAVRGAHSKWNWDAAYALSYKGNNTYQVALSGVDLSGGFKLAGDTENWDPQFIAFDGSKMATAMQLDVPYDMKARIGTSAIPDPGNNTMTLGAGNYIMTFKVTEALVDNTLVGNMSVCQPE